MLFSAPHWQSFRLETLLHLRPFRIASGMSRTIVPSGSQARLILVGTGLLLTLGMGMRQSFGLFLAPITHDLAITAADFTLALAVQNIVWGLSQVWSDRSRTVLAFASP